MGPQYGALIFVIGLTIVAMITVSILYPRTIQEYWRRSCMGRAWKRTFPQASKDEIRQFLYMFVDAFAFPKRRALQFAPADRVLDIYRGLYPLKGWPDALELETLALRLEGRYALDLRKIWRDDLTLGEIFSRINSPLAQQSLERSRV
jgi:propanediol dehydratase small subunit